MFVQTLVLKAPGATTAPISVIATTLQRVITKLDVANVHQVMLAISARKNVLWGLMV